MSRSHRPSTPGVVAVVALWVAGMAMVERAFVGGRDELGFVFVQPSPLWLVVLWVAMRAGRRAAVVTGAFVGAWHTLGSSREGFSLELLTAGELWWAMALFSSAAFLIASTRRERSADAPVQSRAHPPLPGAMPAVPQWHGGEQEAIDAALGMLVDVCGASRCSLVQVLPDGLVDFAVYRGWSEADAVRRAREIGDDTLVAAAITRAGLVVAPADPAATSGGAHRPLLVAPVLEEDGLVRMLLCLDELAPGHDLEQVTPQFQVVVTSLGPRLRQMATACGAQTDSRDVLRMLQRNNPIGSVERLSERIHLEDARWRRYAVPSPIVAVRVPSLRHRLATARQEEAVREVFASAVRQTDDAYRFGFTGFYVLVLVGCKADTVGRIEARLAQHFVTAGIRDVVMRAFVPDRQAPSLESLLPRVTEFFFGRTSTGAPVPCPVPPPRPLLRGDLAAFLTRLRLELGVCRRLDSGLNLIEFRGQVGPIAIAPMVARHLSNLAGESLRPTDGIYVLSPECCVVVLPNTDCLDAVTVWRRLDDALAENLPSGYHERLESQSISMRDVDAQQVIVHLLGEPEQTRNAQILTDDELSHLAEQFAAPGG